MEQHETDEKFMRLALNEAQKALKQQEVPIGAVVVAGGAVIGRGHNLVETLADPTAHTSKMPKMKTNSGSKKRFTLTGTGKIKRKHAFHSHILTKKTKKRKRNLCYSTTVDTTNVSQVKELLAMK